EERAHARPDGVSAVRIGAVRAEDHGTSNQRIRGANHRADVAGVRDAVQIDARRDRGLGPSLWPDPDGPRPRSELGEAVEKRRLHLGAAQALTRCGEQLDRLRIRGPSGGEQVLTLADEEALALASPTPAEAANQLQLLVMWAGDGRHSGS